MNYPEFDRCIVFLFKSALVLKKNMVKYFRAKVKGIKCRKKLISGCKINGCTLYYSLNFLQASHYFKVITSRIPNWLIVWAFLKSELTNYYPGDHNRWWQVIVYLTIFTFQYYNWKQSQQLLHILLWELNEEKQLK